jgi:hypothetical protein
MLKHTCPECKKDFWCITKPQDINNEFVFCHLNKEDEKNCLTECKCGNCTGGRGICKNIYHEPKTRKANFIGGVQVIQ